MESKRDLVLLMVAFGFSRALPVARLNGFLDSVFKLLDKAAHKSLGLLANKHKTRLRNGFKDYLTSLEWETHVCNP